MGDKKLHKKLFNKKVLEVSEGWTAPFAHDSAAKAKVAVLAKIGQVRENASASVELPEERKSPKVIRINHITWAKAAAAIALLVCVPYVIWLFGNETHTNDSKQTMVFNLPDGSDVTLAEGASVHYNSWIWPLSRRVSLDGEGFFSVEHGSTFRVVMPAGQVKVLGTEFSVWSGKDAFMVHCASGKVMVSMKGVALELESGQFTRRSADTELAIKQSYASMGPVFPEKSGLLNCDNMPLGMVLAQIERALDLVIYSELDASLKYSGTLDLNRTNECLELVCKPYGAKFETNADGYVTIKP